MPFSTYLPEHMGFATLSPSGPFVAGTPAELTLGEFPDRRFSGKVVRQEIFSIPVSSMPKVPAV